MARRRLNTFVHVGGQAYGPEDDVPDEVAEQITAPGVWADEPKAKEPSAAEKAAAATGKPKG